MAFVVARATARKAANAVGHYSGHNGPGQSVVHKLNVLNENVRFASTGTNPIHGPKHCPSKPPRVPHNKLFTQSKHLLSRLFIHLSAPGLRVPAHVSKGGAEAVRSLHSGALPTIKSGMSFHSRVALSSGSRNIFLPRAPAPAVRVATNVGLGISRNFSTGRPIFQNLVDNVPVIGRAFYEADLDLKKGTGARPMRNRGKKSLSTKGKGKELLKPRESTIEAPSAASLEESQADVSMLFRNTVAPVTTYLLVPLAPTPSSRVPLPPQPISSAPPTILPPLSWLKSFHAAHETHAARVSSLFSRLDQARVWNNGARYSAYGLGNDGEGVCTIIKVEFVGWTKKDVRSVIGEGGKGWCVLEEVRLGDSGELSELSLFDHADIEQVERSAKGLEQVEDPTQSLIMPTLDFSDSFIDSTSNLSTSSSLNSSASTSPMMSPTSDVFASALEVELDDPWFDGISSSEIGSPAITDNLDVDAFSEPSSGPYDGGSETSWQSIGTLQFSSHHANRWVVPA